MTAHQLPRDATTDELVARIRALRHRMEQCFGDDSYEWPSLWREVQPLEHECLRRATTADPDQTAAAYLESVQ